MNMQQALQRLLGKPMLQEQLLLVRQGLIKHSRIQDPWLLSLFLQQAAQRFLLTTEHQFLLK
jgi:hypothetical protein